MLVQGRGWIARDDRGRPGMAGDCGDDRGPLQIVAEEVMI